MRGMYQSWLTPATASQNLLQPANVYYYQLPSLLVDILMEAQSDKDFADQSIGDTDWCRPSSGPRPQPLQAGQRQQEHSRQTVTHPLELIKTCYSAGFYPTL